MRPRVRMHVRAYAYYDRRREDQFLRERYIKHIVAKQVISRLSRLVSNKISWELI